MRLRFHGISTCRVNSADYPCARVDVRCPHTILPLLSFAISTISKVEFITTSDSDSRSDIIPIQRYLIAETWPLIAQFRSLIHISAMFSPPAFQPSLPPPPPPAPVPSFPRDSEYDICDLSSSCRSFLACFSLPSFLLRRLSFQLVSVLDSAYTSAFTHRVSS